MAIHNVQPVAPWFDLQTEQDLVYDLYRERIWTKEAYLVFSEAFNRPMELSDGHLLLLPLPSLTHQRIAGNLFEILTAWLKAHPCGFALFASHPIRLGDGKYREPDIMFWLNEYRERLGEHESGPPNLAVEILSPSNASHDTRTKFREYAEAGIEEYWIINPITASLSIYSLSEANYALLGDFHSGERAQSSIVPGFELEISELFLMS